MVPGAWGGENVDNKLVTVMAACNWQDLGAGKLWLMRKNQDRHAERSEASLFDVDYSDAYPPADSPDYATDFSLPSIVSNSIRRSQSK
jgi:hypothetical protein